MHTSVFGPGLSHEMKGVDSLPLEAGILGLTHRPVLPHRSLSMKEATQHGLQETQGDYPEATQQCSG